LRPARDQLLDRLARILHRGAGAACKASTNSLTEFRPAEIGKKMALSATSQILAMQNQDARMVLQML
jgi:hypothetical protein